MHTALSHLAREETAFTVLLAAPNPNHRDLAQQCVEELEFMSTKNTTTYQEPQAPDTLPHQFFYRHDKLCVRQGAFQDQLLREDNTKHQQPSHGADMDIIEELQGMAVSVTVLKWT